MKIEILVYNEDKENNKKLKHLLLSDHGENVIAGAIHEVLQKRAIKGSNVIVGIKEVL